ncbi:hypothetical protein [Micromonospora sp. WMMD812]|uniref:hypothetical protein n=1 Tax=Micromonospora sp. WMMD812 TaxID=3015152 RepID=UPI00248BC05D|nr:hypothetical protein [Micromonospora sp. WMMD812]WBB69054.1 hypothetical protein O7603_06805 [Micromonospora sp. WMMD812]
MLPKIGWRNDEEVVEAAVVSAGQVDVPGGQRVPKLRLRARVSAVAQACRQRSVKPDLGYLTVQDGPGQRVEPGSQVVVGPPTEVALETLGQGGDLRERVVQPAALVSHHGETVLYTQLVAAAPPSRTQVAIRPARSRRNQATDCRETWRCARQVVSVSASGFKPTSSSASRIRTLTTTKRPAPLDVTPAARPVSPWHHDLPNRRHSH